MSRTRKRIKWRVLIGDEQVHNVHSKTYCGAIFKACKKLGIPAPTCTRKVMGQPFFYEVVDEEGNKEFRNSIHKDVVSRDFKNPLQIRYDNTYGGIYCIPEEEARRLL